VKKSEREAQERKELAAMSAAVLVRVASKRLSGNFAGLWREASAGRASDRGELTTI